jgi:hypothetical protein
MCRPQALCCSIAQAQDAAIAAIRALTDPAKIATLKDPRACNDRLPLSFGEDCAIQLLKFGYRASLSKFEQAASQSKIICVTNTWSGISPSIPKNRAVD